MVLVLNLLSIDASFLPEQVYESANAAINVLWVFVTNLFVAMLGWLIVTIYYRCGAPSKTLIIIVLYVAFWGVGILDDIYNGGAIRLTLGRFWYALMGLSTEPSNIFVGITSMLVLSAVFAYMVFLLIRRVQFKDW
ncbi:MAG: hypothetical protein HY779_04375 [Rubrobacteridae bacterium]|nr:hypothetical protein [Rubrobacteridae bacterium]